MNLQTELRNEAVRISLSGRFDAFETDLFRDQVASLLDTGEFNIEVELSHVNFIDSSGLAELVRARAGALEGGGSLVLIRPSAPVSVILELTQLDSVFTISSDDDAPSQVGQDR